MSRIRLIIFFCFFVSIGLAQVPDFLNNEKIVPRINLKSSFSERYQRLMWDLADNSSDAKKKAKCEEKLVKFFLKNISSKITSEEREVAYYQMGHYYAFGVFDVYFNEKPSDIDRSSLKPTNKDLALSYLNRAKHLKGYLMLIPNTWLTNYEAGLGFSQMVYNEIVKLIQSMQGQQDFHINFFNSGKYSETNCSFCGEKNYPWIPAFFEYFNAMLALPDGHPIKSQLLPEMSTDDLVGLALSFQKNGRHYETLYYSALAAARGNLNGLVLSIDELTSLFLGHCQEKHPSELSVGIPYREMVLLILCIKMSIGDNLIQQQEFLSQLADYYENLGDELFERYDAEVKARKIERRKAMWRNIGMAFAQALYQTGSQITEMQYNTQQFSPQVNSAGIGNLKSLIDPRLAAQQVYNQYYNNYIQFCAYNRKPDGSMYSFDEWMSIQAQALANLKEQGVDFVAEQQAQIEKDKKEWRDDLEEDRRRRLNRKTNLTNEQTANNKNSGNSTGTSNHATDYSSNYNVDYNQNNQVNTDPSGDYRKIKTVTLYYRDGDYAKVKMNNVDLCRKGAIDYIKIGNKYYRRCSPNWLRFSHAIAYGHEQLYYND